MPNGACHSPVHQAGGVRGCVSPAMPPPQDSPDPTLQLPPTPGIPSPTLLWVSPESGDTDSGLGLGGLSDTELDRASPPFSWEGAGREREQGSSSPGVWERPLEPQKQNPSSPHIIPCELQAHKYLPCGPSGAGKD